jgi:TIR domain
MCAVSGDDVTDGQHRLLDSVAVSMEKLAWDHLRQNLGASVSKSPRAEVFISHRSSEDAFAEALARRLGQESIVPFFDKWDVKAGDSIPGKIEGAFGRSIACVIILSDDFILGQWATAEMDTAITKRIQEDYRVIPVLYEKCDVPELLKPLRHVDFSSHDPQTFESKFGELIDAIYGLELNPFRG